MKQQPISHKFWKIALLQSSGWKIRKLRLLIAACSLDALFDPEE
jgi:hypothetical protein